MGLEKFLSRPKNISFSGDNSGAIFIFSKLILFNSERSSVFELDVESVDAFLIEAIICSLSSTEFRFKLNFVMIIF